MGHNAYAGARNIWEIFVFSSQYCCKSKTALKTVIFKIKKKENMKQSQLIKCGSSFLDHLGNEITKEI